MSSYPLRERRKRATRAFYLRVTVITLLMVGIAYVGWFAPWAKPLTTRTPAVQTAP